MGEMPTAGFSFSRILAPLNMSFHSIVSLVSRISLPWFSISMDLDPIIIRFDSNSEIFSELPNGVIGRAKEHVRSGTQQ
jgi:hypothetical protein